MLKTNPIVHKVSVSKQSDSALVVCVSYGIDRQGKHFGEEFYELVTTFSNKGISIPYDRQETFQEELRVCATAADITPEYRKDIEQWIESKMKEAYGNDAMVSVELFKK